MRSRFSGKSCRVLVALAIGLCAVLWGRAGSGPAGGDPATRQAGTAPASAPASGPAARRIDRVVQFFLKMYDTPLKSQDWVNRAMAVISLARIDDPRVTERLMEVMSKDPTPVVRVYAWEALHARNATLGADARRRWLAGGVDLAVKSHLRGDLRVGLLDAVCSAGPTRAGKELFCRLFENTNSLDPADIRTLEAMGQVLVRWKSPDLIRGLIGEMGNVNSAYRAEFVLKALSPKARGADIWHNLGSREMWRRARSAWQAWLAQANPTEAGPGELPPYRGYSALIPAPEKIADPNDPQWRRNLELPPLRLRQLEVAFVVDSTGSMGSVLYWIRRDVLKVMRAFHMVSREPRLGVTLYRDHGDLYVTKVVRLTDDAEKLEQALRKTTPQGGGDVPEAVLEALVAALTRQPWSAGAGACKVVILVGDAPPHARTGGRIRRLVQAAAEKGFRFHCVKAFTRYGARDLSSFDQIAAWGRGKAIAVEFERTHVRRDGPVAAPEDRGPYRQIVGLVMKEILADAYHDRAEPFVDVLLECMKEPEPEERRPHVPYRPYRGGFRGGGARPRHPQAR